MLHAFQESSQILNKLFSTDMTAKNKMFCPILFYLNDERNNEGILAIIQFTIKERTWFCKTFKGYAWCLLVSIIESDSMSVLKNK